GLIDGDVVELSNLPRQPLYGTGDVGSRKVEAAARRLRAHHPEIDVTVHDERVDEASAARLLAGYQVIVDGTDSLASKALLNAAALALGTPLVHAGALGLEGQLMTILPGRSTCLRCLFPELPPDDDMPSCQQAGILGPVVGAIGLMAAGEAARIVAGRRPTLVDRLAILDGARLRWRTVELRPNPLCPACDAGRTAAPGAGGA
ncbi:MAG: HesA/MoeB/ThiF family protein, partial [Thermodesulfobacteriota bacterium]